MACAVYHLLNGNSARATTALYGQKGNLMGATKRMIMEMEDQLAEKAFRDNEARKLVDADGYHMVNCQCDDCLYVEDKLASDNT